MGEVELGVVGGVGDVEDGRDVAGGNGGFFFVIAFAFDVEEGGVGHTAGPFFSFSGVVYLVPGGPQRAKDFLIGVLGVPDRIEREVFADVPEQVFVFCDKVREFDNSAFLFVHITAFCLIRNKKRSKCDRGVKFFFILGVGTGCPQTRVGTGGGGGDERVRFFVFF